VFHTWVPVTTTWVLGNTHVLANRACGRSVPHDLTERNRDRTTWVDGRRMAVEEQAMNYDERIERRPNVAGGEAVIKGTRVTLRTVLASLAEGATTAEILQDFPTLTEADVRAAIAFAAASAQEDLPVGAAHVR
jgi:uncharacterized protein (DUF433 family)